MYTYTIVGGGGGALPASPLPLNTCSHNTATRRPPHPSNTQQHTTTDNNTQQQYTTALRYIKLPMYQLFLWRLYIMVLRSATSLRGALEGVGPEPCTPQNHYVPRHKNNRYINSYSIRHLRPFDLQDNGKVVSTFRSTSQRQFT
jgi:hypothetical protein